MNVKRFYITEYGTADIISGPHTQREAQALVGPDQKIRTEAQMKIVRGRGAPAGNQNAKRIITPARAQFSGEADVRGYVEQTGGGSFSAGVAALVEFHRAHAD